MTQEKEEFIRAFIAINLPQKIKQKLQDVSNLFREHLKDTRTRVAWVNYESIHLTLKFLGSIENILVDPIIQRLEKATLDINPFIITLGDIGVFPNQNLPRVIWIGVKEGAEQICLLQKSVEDAINDLGFKSERGKFSPHLTLGRIKGLGSRGEVLRALHSLKGVEIGALEIVQVYLMKSKLTPKGAIYTELGSATLKRD